MPDVPMPRHIPYLGRAPYTGRWVSFVDPEYPAPVVVFLLRQATATHANVQERGGHPFAVPWEHLFPLNPEPRSEGTRLMNPKPSATSRLVAALDTARKEPKRPKATKGRDPAKILADIAEGRKVLTLAVSKFKVATDNLQDARKVMHGLSAELRMYHDMLDTEIDGGPNA